MRPPDFASLKLAPSFSKATSPVRSSTSPARSSKVFQNANAILAKAIPPSRTTEEARAAKTSLRVMSRSSPMFRAKCKANQELGNRRRVHTPMRRRSTLIVQPRLFDARTGGSERQFATPFTTAGRVEQVGTWWCGYCRSFFACEGNLPLLTVKRRVPVVAPRSNVVLAHRRTFLADVWNRGGDREIAVLVMNALVSIRKTVRAD